MHWYILPFESEAVRLEALAKQLQIDRPCIQTFEDYRWKKLSFQEYNPTKWPPPCPALMCDDSLVSESAAVLGAYSESNSISQSIDFIRQLPRCAPCIFCFGLPGLHDYSVLFSKELLLFPSPVCSEMPVSQGIGNFEPRGCVTSRHREAMKALWRRFGFKESPLTVIAYRGKLNPPDWEIQEGFRFRHPIEENKDAAWDRFDCEALEPLCEVAASNSGGHFVTVWPSYCDETIVRRLLQTWRPGYGELSLSTTTGFGPNDWCCLLGAGCLDSHETCIVGSAALDALGGDFAGAFVF